MINCGAHGVIVTTGCFTRQAIAFAVNKPISLMDMDALLHAARGRHSRPRAATAVPNVKPQAAWTRKTGSTWRRLPVCLWAGRWASRRSPTP